MNFDNFCGFIDFVGKDQSRESPPRLINRTTCININLKNNSPVTSPVNSPTGSPTIPCPTPNSSPSTPTDKALAAKRVCIYFSSIQMYGG